MLTRILSSLSFICTLFVIRNKSEKTNCLLRILVSLLGNGHDALTLAVALHDIGEYVRHYPRGKTSVKFCRQYSISAIKIYHIFTI